MSETDRLKKSGLIGCLNDSDVISENYKDNIMMTKEESAKIVFRVGFLEGFCAAKRQPDYDKAWKETEKVLDRANLGDLMKERHIDREY